MPQCYMCENEVTTDEHVPPKCLFPEPKDLQDGKDYKINLITVPSCDDHNLKKSGDDEYLLFILASNVNSNSIAQKQYTTKIRRAMKNRPTKFSIFRNPQPIQYRGVETAVFQIDKERINRQFDLIARGLYFKLFQEKCHHNIMITSPFTISVGDGKSKERNEASRKAVSSAKLFLEKKAKLGENPDVFYYQIKKKTDGGFIMRMVFYGGVEVAALSNPQLNL